MRIDSETPDEKKGDVIIGYGRRDLDRDPYHAGNIDMAGTTWSSKRGSEAGVGNEKTIASPIWEYRP